MNEFNNNENSEKNELPSEPENGTENNNDYGGEFTENNDVLHDSETSENFGGYSQNFSQDREDNEYRNSYEPIQYSEVKPIESYKSVSRGLKVFSIVIAAVILLTGSCTAGYFLGKSKASFSSGGKVSVDLAAKPKDTDESTAAEVYEQINKSIVGIYVYNTSGLAAQASGVIYSDDGYVVTNDHIYSEVPLPKFKVYTYDGKEYDAEYVAGDSISDLAVIKVKNANLKAAVFGNSGELYCGENVVAVGRPNGAAESSSITKGIISALNRRVKTTSNYSSRLIQTDSAINPGSSGGALVNMYGQVVGITSSKLAGVAYDLVGYSIPTTTVKRIVEELISNGKVTTRAKLGITYTAIDSVMSGIKGYDYVGLYVASVGEDSDLYGKLSAGDVITHINGIEITKDDVVLDIIDDSKAGDKVTLTVISSGSTREYEATLRANIGESSYKTQSSDDDGSSFSSGGSFNFPQGE